MFIFAVPLSDFLNKNLQFLFLSSFLSIDICLSLSHSLTHNFISLFLCPSFSLYINLYLSLSLTLFPSPLFRFHSYTLDHTPTSSTGKLYEKQSHWTLHGINFVWPLLSKLKQFKLLCYLHLFRVITFCCHNCHKSQLSQVTTIFKLHIIFALYLKTPRFIGETRPGDCQ